MNIIKAREEAIIKEAQAQMPKLKIKPIAVEKNNGKIYKGISICRQGGGNSMVLYWPGIWYDCGECSTDETVAGYICSKAEEELDVRIDHENLFKWETARSMIHKKLINYKKNAVRLNKVAHRRYLDLAEVYYMYIQIPEKGWSMAEISSEHLEDWGIGMDELEAAASSHITLDQYRLQPLEDILKDMLEGMECPMDTSEACAYVLWSNSDRFAAAAMTEPGLMKEFMERIGSDCYILPSSVYELIAIPCRKGTDVDRLHEMVQEVNRDVVSPEDFLSDSVYYWHADSGKVELCRV